MATELEALSAQVREAFVTARQSDTSTEYDLLAQQCGELASAARETMQANLSGQYLDIIRKLEDDQPLAQNDMSLIELIIVGDAESFLRNESDVGQWQQELENLAAKMEAIEDSGLDSVENLMRLRALCRNSGDVANRIALFYREKERVDSFRQSTAGPLTVEVRTTLAEIIRAMMSSDTM